MTSTDVTRRSADEPEEEGPPEEVAIETPTLTEDGVISTETVDIKGAIDPPVHKPTLAQWSPWDEKNRRLIVPVWARSWKNFRAWMIVNLREAGFIVTWHITRSPFYLARIVWDTVKGLRKAIAQPFCYVMDTQSMGMASAAKMRGDDDSWNKARKEWRRTAGPRLRNTVLAAVPLAGFAGWAAFVLPGWGFVTAAVVVVGLLAWLGHEPGTKLVDDYYINNSGKAVKLTSAMIFRALGGLGIAKIDSAIKEDPRYGIMFRGPIQRDDDAGYKAVMELPAGVTAADIIERREKLASGLRKPLGTVWPEPVRREHPGILSLFVGDKDINEIEQGSWPLMSQGMVDLFKPVPFGTDQRGRPVWITLMFASGVIGAIPRMGKTFSLRELLLIAALDPRAKVYALDKKGSGDLSPLEYVAHGYTVGDDRADILQDLTYLRELREEMRRRYKVLRKLPKWRAPESKVTPDIASDRKLGMEPVFVGIDECQFLFEHKKYGAEFIELCTDIVKRGPACGIMLWLATQRPDAKSIPTAIRDNAVMRFCLKVMAWAPSDDVLGTGMHKAGIKATIFSREDLGIGYLVGEGDEPRIVKTYYINSEQAENIAKRAKAIRIRQGRLTGYSAGEEERPEENATLSDDLPRVFVTSERMHSEDVIDRLQEIRPGTYDGWTPTTLAMACRDQLGLETKQIKIDGKTLAGLRQETVHEAVAAYVEQSSLPPGSPDSTTDEDQGQ